MTLSIRVRREATLHQHPQTRIVTYPPPPPHRFLVFGSRPEPPATDAQFPLPFGLVLLVKVWRSA